jgi:poly(3-hydroxybutyrate) depolymerase
MLYYLHELHRLSMMPARAVADAVRFTAQHPMNPLAYTPLGRSFNAAAEVFEQVTRRYGKPEWGIATTEIGRKQVPVTVETAMQRSYCQLLHFRRDIKRNKDPRLLIVAPLSGHYATLLRGTVETMLPNHDVYITD